MEKRREGEQDVEGNILVCVRPDVQVVPPVD